MEFGVLHFSENRILSKKTWSTLVENMVKYGQRSMPQFNLAFCGASIHPRHINKEESTTEIFSADHPTIGYESLRALARLQGWSRNWNLRGKQKNCGQR